MFVSGVRRFLTTLLLVGAVATLAVSFAIGLIPPPLAPPDLSAPTDSLTGRRLALLARDPSLCTAVLRASGPAHSQVPSLSNGQCGYSNAVRLKPKAITLTPSNPPLSCPLAAATHLWLRDVVEPAAQAHFGARLVAVDHLGSYACRNMYGRAEGRLSEHAHANALDVAGFRLSDGRRITLLRHWNGTAAERAFLREVRDGACGLYGTTLSPDYNEAHRDHFHLDMAVRAGGWFGGLCR